MRRWAHHLRTSCLRTDRRFWDGQCSRTARPLQQPKPMPDTAAASRSEVRERSSAIADNRVSAEVGSPPPHCLSCANGLALCASRGLRVRSSVTRRIRRVSTIEPAGISAHPQHVLEISARSDDFLIEAGTPCAFRTVVGPRACPHDRQHAADEDEGSQDLPVSRQHAKNQETAHNCGYDDQDGGTGAFHHDWARRRRVRDGNDRPRASVPIAGSLAVRVGIPARRCRGYHCRLT